MNTIVRMSALCRAAVLLVCAMTLAACGAVQTTGTSATSSAATATNSLTSPSSTPGDVIALTASTFTVAQNAGMVSVTVARSGNTATAVTVDYATLDGTATSGAQYTTTAGTLQWAENDATTKTITVPIIAGAAFSGIETFEVVLSNPSDGAQLGSPGTATISITGDSAGSAGTLQLADAAYTVAQSASSVTVVVNRTGGSAGAVSVAYATGDGTALAGTDYTAAQGVLNWADGDATPKSFSIVISNASPFSGTKSFQVALSGATSGAAIGTPSAATVSITGDATAPAGSLQFAASNYSVSQSANSVTISVARVGGSYGALSVSYATSSGSAVAGTDYTAVSGTLNWADGDATAKSFSVPISNATPFSGIKTFTAVLSNPGPTTTIQNPGSATVTITGDAASPAGTVVLSAASYTAAQSAGTFNITVQRQGGDTGAVSVSYATAGGTAIAGTNFTATSGTLNWTNGDSSSKTFAIAISNAAPFSGTKSFTVSISDPSGGAVLGTPSAAAVIIEGDAVAAIGDLQLASSSYAVAQASGSVTVTVNRTGGSSGAVSVAYATVAGTAIAGTNFTTTSGTLNWASGDSSSKTFAVTVGSAPFSGTKSFSVTLSNPTGGATLSTPNTATVTISGSEAASGTFWVYYNGMFNWGGDYSSGAVPNYKSTAGDPESGPYDIAMTLTGPYGLWAPYAGGTVPTWNFNATGYNYITFDLKPTVANQKWQFYFMQVHDVPIIGPLGLQTFVNVADYGPAPVPGKWATYKIPLSVVLTQYSSGSPVYETSVYKFGLQDETGLSQNTWYIDNVGFTQ